MELVAGLASMGDWQAANDGAKEIPNYRQALARLKIIEVKIKRGAMTEAANDLLSLPKLPLDGVSQQRWEILARQLSLAEAVGIYPQMLQAFRNAAIEVPPMFGDGVEERFLDAASSSSTVDPEQPLGRRSSQKLQTRLPSQTVASPDKPASSPGGGMSLEASEGGEKLMARMKIRMGNSALLARAEGLLAIGQVEEAKQLLQLPLLDVEGYRFSSPEQQAEFLMLANRCGLAEQAQPFLRPLLNDLKVYPPLHGSLGSYLASGIVLASLEGRKDEARALLEYGLKSLRQHSEFSRNENLADLGAGCWRAGLEREARNCWRLALEGAAKIPNPPSRAVGAFQVLMAQVASGASLGPEEAEQIKGILKALPEAYAGVGL